MLPNEEASSQNISRDFGMMPSEMLNPSLVLLAFPDAMI